MIRKLLALPLFVLLLLFSNPAEAQFLKKLKKTVEDAAERTVLRKADRKTEEVTDKTIDGALEGNKEKREDEKERPKESKKQQSTHGDATISGPDHESIAISRLSQPKIYFDEEQDITEIIGWWWSHGVDVFDGYKITIKGQLDAEGEYPIRFATPSEASFSISYDPLMAADQGKDWKREEDPDFEMIRSAQKIIGSVTIQEFSDEAIAFSFKGSGYSGSISAQNPEIRIIAEDEEQKAEEALNTLFFGQSSVPDKVFSFNTEIKALMTTDDKEEFPVSFLSNPEEEYLGMIVDVGQSGKKKKSTDQGTGIVVMDGDDTRIFMESSGTKMQIAATGNMAKAYTDQVPDMEEYEHAKPVKTGRTKTILGYLCHEYTMEMDGNKMNFWNTEEDLGIKHWMSKENVEGWEELGYKGFMMEFTATDEKGHTTHMIVTDINNNASVKIDSREYSKMF